MGLNPEDGHELRVLPRFADGALGTHTGDDGRIGAKPFEAAVTRADVEPEWRDAAEVTGWAAACACARLNTGDFEATLLGTFTRARTPQDAVEGIAYYAGTYDDVVELDGSGPERYGQILWDGHLTELSTMRELRDAARAARQSQTQLDFYVDLARSQSKSWTEIGAATGLTRQGARQRWADKVSPVIDDTQVWEAGRPRILAWTTMSDGHRAVILEYAGPDKVQVFDEATRTKRTVDDSYATGGLREVVLDEVAKVAAAPGPRYGAVRAAGKVQKIRLPEGSVAHDPEWPTGDERSDR